MLTSHVVHEYFGDKQMSINCVTSIRPVVPFCQHLKLLDLKGKEAFDGEFMKAWHGHLEEQQDGE